MNCSYGLSLSGSGVALNPGLSSRISCVGVALGLFAAGGTVGRAIGASLEKLTSAYWHEPELVSVSSTRVGSVLTISIAEMRCIVSGSISQRYHVPPCGALASMFWKK